MRLGGQIGLRRNSSNARLVYGETPVLVPVLGYILFQVRIRDLPFLMVTRARTRTRARTVSQVPNRIESSWD